MERGINQYSKIVNDYAKSKETPVNLTCISPSFEMLFNNLKTEDVIDLGCGTGFYTEKVRRMTSGLVYGLDISPEMIEAAKVKATQGITYLVADAIQPSQIEQRFDIALCSFLLNYAKDEKMLDGFLTNAFSLLKPGGRIVGINTNFDLKAEDFAICSKYGITYAVSTEVEQKGLTNGDLIQVTMESKDLDFECRFWNVYHTREIYERSFAKAGFVKLRTIPLSCHSEFEVDQAYFKDFIDHCLHICFEAQKPNEDPLELAIKLAHDNVVYSKGMPFGAVITNKDGEIVGQGANQVIQNNDPSAHAEIVAIRQACENLRTFNLEQCTLYTSCEPCLMCFGAIHWSGLREVFFAANKPDAATSGFTDELMCAEFISDNKDRSLKFVEISHDQKLIPFRKWDVRESKY